jgi:hypothetical protein
VLHHLEHRNDSGVALSTTGRGINDASLPACTVSNVPGAGAARLAFYVANGSDGHMLPRAQVIRPLQLTRHHG